MTKKNTVVRVLALVLAALMVACIFCACANESKPKDKDKNKPADDIGEGTYKADIPDGIDYGDEEFIIYAYPLETLVWIDYDWHNEGTNGDPISEAVYTRSSQVEQELGITIVPFNRSEYGAASEFSLEVGAGNDAFDVANLKMLEHIEMVQNGYLWNLNTYGCLDLEAPWWDQNILRDLSIADMNFCIVGDIGTMYKRCIACLIFNKDIYDKYKQYLDNPYELVVSKAWTIEAFSDMVEIGVSENTGSERWTEEDTYGFICFSDVLGAMEIGSNVEFAKKNKDTDTPEITLNSDKTVMVLNKLATVLLNEETTYNVTPKGQNETTMWDMFMNDQAFFYYGELHSAEDMRGMKTDFGILPIPMFDEEQENYRHTVNPNVAAVYCIPKTNTDETKTSYVLDALGAASKNILTPAYYDKNLMNRVSRDDESEISLNYIFSTMTYDMGYLYLRETGDIFRNVLKNGTVASYATEYAKVEKALPERFEAIISAVLSKN